MLLYVRMEPGYIELATPSEKHHHREKKLYSIEQGLKSTHHTKM
jgi:hypothetical protein